MRLDTLGRMEIVKQLSVFLDNQPGTLAAVCEELANAKINIYALTISDTTDHSVVRMVLSDPLKAQEMFEERGVLVIDNNVLMFENSNKPGALAKIAQRLAKADINIEYAYLATSPKAKNGLLILRTSDTKAALKVLKKLDPAG
ncbi:MAG TPA: ACT domain-containing protein [Chthoniobacteraceae bacterium]